jgi:integrase
MVMKQFMNAGDFPVVIGSVRHSNCRGRRQTKSTQQDIGKLDAVRARRGKRLPVVLSAEEVARVLPCVEGAGGTYGLMARLLYGAGIRREECCRLRVHDLDLRRDQFIVRRGKWGQGTGGDVAESLKAELERHPRPNSDASIFVGCVGRSQAHAGSWLGLVTIRSGGDYLCRFSPSGKTSALTRSPLK